MDRMIQMKRIIQMLILWFVLGCLYYVLEGLWHIPLNGGYANIIMLPIGGLCGVLVGALNQTPKFYRMKVIWQVLIGTLLVLSVEFICGYFLNIRMGLGIWDYSNMPFNLMGQICLPYALLWLLLLPFAIWLEDFLRLMLWGEGEYYSLGSLYKKLISLQELA